MTGPMRLRLMIDVMADESDVPRLAEWMAQERVVMVDGGGDEKSFTGRFSGAVPVFEGDGNV